MSDDVPSKIAQQRELYGAPLRELADRVMSALGLTQARLAEALGLSAPMLSQLLSGRRIKIGNPAVVQRLQALLALAEEAPGLTPEQIRAKVAAAHDVQGTFTTARQPSHDESAAAWAALRASAAPAELTAAADLVAERFPRLADLLREAATEPARG